MWDGLLLEVEWYDVSQIGRLTILSARVEAWHLFDHIESRFVAIFVERLYYFDLADATIFFDRKLYDDAPLGALCHSRWRYDEVLLDEGYESLRTPRKCGIDNIRLGVSH